MATEPIRVLLVDDHVLFRKGLARLLDAEWDIHVAGEAATTIEALRHLERLDVDVLLLDYDLGHERGSRLMMAMAERGWNTRVLVVAAGLTDRQVVELIQGGAAGIVMKSEPPESLLSAIRKVNAGEAWLKQDHLRLLATAGAASSGGDKPLTGRERVVLRGVIEGLSNKQIAAELRISESSVKAALQQLFARAGVRTRSQLVRVGLEQYRGVIS